MCLENFRHKKKEHSSYLQVGYLSSSFIFTSILDRPPCWHPIWEDTDKGGLVCDVWQATFLDGGDEHFRKSLWDNSDLKEDIGMAWIEGMLFIFLLWYLSHVGWLGTQPQSQADFIHPWYPLLCFGIYDLYFQKYPLYLFVYSPLCTWALTCCPKF